LSVLIDTSVWSRALRRSRVGTNEVARELGYLIREDLAVLIGPIRQELLSGVRSASQFELLKSRVRAFPDLELVTSDYEEAAMYFNQCRARGIQGSSVDFLICATATRRRMSIFTTDGDFQIFARVLPIKLHHFS